MQVGRVLEVTTTSFCLAQRAELYMGSVEDRHIHDTLLHGLDKDGI